MAISSRLSYRNARQVVSSLNAALKHDVSNSFLAVYGFPQATNSHNFLQIAKGKNLVIFDT